MPQLLVLVAAGAGLYTAYRWLSRQAERAEIAAKRAADDVDKGGAGGTTAGSPRDLGALVWDEASQSYRPKS